MLCERVEVVPGTRGFSLVGLFQVLRFSAFPSPPQRFTVYTILYDGVGEGTIKLSFTQLETERETHRYRKWFQFTGRQQFAHLEMPMTRCVFPAPGRYSLTLSFDDQEIDYRMLDVFEE
jgi:hypothetical protein